MQKINLISQDENSKQRKSINCGISSACYYPLYTEDSVLELAKNGVFNIEIFVNYEGELKSAPFKEIKKVVNDFNLNITSLHPNTFIENHSLYGNYDRRYVAALDYYKLHFDTLRELRKNRPDNEPCYIVTHGPRETFKYDFSFFLERFAALSEVASSFGVTLTQENIAYCKSGSLLFLSEMVEKLPKYSHFTIDLKQIRRCHNNTHIVDFINTLGNKITCFHISDYDLENDCLPPGKGIFDFKKFFKDLDSINFSGNVLIELYRENFSDTIELINSYKYIEELINDSNYKN